MKVLSVTSECAPLVKTGGLADVAGALPAALAPHGVEMRTLLPGYPAVMAAIGESEVVWEGETGAPGGPARLIIAKTAGLELLVYDAPQHFGRDGNIYLGPDGKDWPDNPERFAALCQAAVTICDGEADGWTPDIVHCHDWQAGFAPYYLKGAVPTLLTIHNIAFHGLAEAAKLKALDLAEQDFTRDGFEFWGRISALKAGLLWSTKINTVSETYAAELMRPEFGMGMDGVLKARADDFSGILNGIDLDAWNPATDGAISTYKTPRGKAKAKRTLQNAMGLPDDACGPLCVVISRLTEQKGLDLLAEALPALLDRGGQLALLGSGDARFEQQFHGLAKDRNVAVRIGYDEPLSHRMIAGGDAILVPSRFEPCGLTQLYGLRYGTIPLVSLTGGLADTVIPASPAALAKKAATGLQFHPVTSDALARALIKLCDLYAAPEIWNQMQRNAMSHPVGWDTSAASYAALYKDLAGAE